MLYRPHFCCHCGEKIVRSKWTLLTSRRFCEFCAVEQQQHDLIPRAAAVALIIFGAAGFTSYLGTKDTPVSIVHPKQQIHGLRTASTVTAGDQKSPNSGGVNASRSVETNSQVPQSNTASADTKQRVVERNSSTEPVHYCGAITKKGTACTRRVKGGGRCWQHAGQPTASALQN